MLPLVKPGDWIKYKMGKRTYTHKCFQSRPHTVWVNDDKGKVVQLHKTYHNIEIVEPPKGRKEDKEKPQEKLDELFNELISRSRSS